MKLSNTNAEWNEWANYVLKTIEELVESQTNLRKEIQITRETLLQRLNNNKLDLYKDTTKNMQKIDDRLSDLEKSQEGLKGKITTISAIIATTTTILISWFTSRIN